MYKVLRDDVQAPGGMPAQIQAPTASSADASQGGGPLLLAIPVEKELTELQGRLWSQCYRDDYVGVYVCVRSKNLKKQLLRIDLRCEKVAPEASITNVGMKLPAGVVGQEVGPDGLLSLVAGELSERSAKLKANLGIAPFLAPVGCNLVCELQYSLAGVPAAGELTIALPPTLCLLPTPRSEDDVGAYIQSARLEQSTQTASIAVPERTVEQLGAELPTLVGRCAGLCNFHGIQQPGASASKGQKFLLMAQPPAPTAGTSPLENQEAMPAGSLVVCLCGCMAKESGVDIRMTVKSCRKDVCEAVCGQLLLTFRELFEGRLRAS